MVRRFRFEILFYIGFVLVGLASLTLTPPLQVPDEGNHFHRAVQISLGGMLPVRTSDSVGAWVPDSLWKIGEVDRFSDPRTKHFRWRDFIDWARAKPSVEWNDRREVAIPNTALYFPFGYFPQAIGSALGRVLGLSPYAVFYLGRIVALLVWAAVFCLALQQLSWWRRPLALFLFLPMVVFLTASQSYDGALLALSTLLFAVAMRTLQDQDCSGLRTVSLFLLAGLIGLTKSVYAPLGLCAVVVAAGSLRKEKRPSFLLWGAVASFVPNMLWTLAVRKYYVPVIAEASAPQQLHYLLQHPFVFPGLVAKELFHHAGRHWHSLVGYLGLWDAPVSSLYALLSFLVFAGMLFFSRVPEHDPRLPRLTRWFIAVMLTAVVVVIYAMVYATYNAPGADFIHGVQGRYFLPLLPWLVAITPKRRIGWLGEGGARGLLMAGVGMSALVLLVTLYRHF